MLLKDLLCGVSPSHTNGELDVEVSELTLDSRKVAPGAVFFALPGSRTDGNRYIRQAVSKGASAIVSELGTLALTLDAHRHHPHPFNESELRPHYHAAVPACQREAVQCRKIMRKPRPNHTSRPILEALHNPYLDSSQPSIGPLFFFNGPTEG